jgi:hypothetical protein
VLNRFLNRVDELKRIVKRGWGYDDVETDSPNPIHVISNIWQRTVSILQGWDYVNNVRRLISVDEFGRVVVTPNPAIGVIPSIYRINVSIIATLVAPVKNNRSYLLVKNIGLNDVFIGTTNAISTTTGYALATNEVINLNDWNTELWAVTGVGTSTLSVIER